MAQDPVMASALAQMERVEADLALKLDALRRAIAALRAVIGAPAPTPVPPPRPRATTRELSTPLRSVAASSAVLPHGKHASAAAHSRERTLLGLIAGGTRDRSVLATELTRDGMTPTQHLQAVGNALQRMKGDDLIIRTDTGWELTAKGRKAAAGAAKEAP